jgi:hypothetical protein
MKPQEKTDPITTRLNEMEATCRLWIAVSAAKDERIKELEAELHMLQQRAARLGRQACRRGQGAMLGARIRSAR